MYKTAVNFFLIFCSISFNNAFGQSSILPDVPEGAEAISFLGTEILPNEPSETAIMNLEEARVKYMDYPTDSDNVIWYGRRLSYADKKREAIKIFSEGIKDHPNDPRIYRHRGHNYISIRELDRAIADFKKAAELVEGKPNEVEPDGAPNEFGIPVSTLHHNIWYHMGLAYYLKHDWENAKKAYDMAFSVARNGDNLSSITHWRYSILRRMGKSHDEAKHVLDAVTADTKVLENHNYKKLDLFYRGEVTLDEMMKSIAIDPEVAADVSITYGVANWLYYNGEEEKSRQIKEALIERKRVWGAFAYIAAEADLAQMQ